MSKDPVREFAQSDGSEFVFRREVLQLLVNINISLMDIMKTVLELGKELK